MMSATRLLVICLLAGAAFAARPAFAQTAGDPRPAEGAPRGGPVVRLRLGPSYLNATIGFGEAGHENFVGGGFGFDAEIGGPVSPNVTVGAELSGALALDASAGDTTFVSGGASSADVSTAGIGASFTYTFNPGNIYLATNPAITILRTSSPDHFFLAKNWGSNYFGVGIGFVVGGQWRVSSGWQLGVAGEARYAAVSGVGDISTLSAYALFFSATYD
jgi:hypothetical protein